MANHPSAEKRNRQRIRRTEQKRAQRSAVRTTVKQAREALHSGAKTAGELVAAAERALARAAQKGVVTKKSSSRITSRLAAAVSKLAAPTSKAAAASKAAAPKAAAKR